jgi:hypothetical protein
MKMKRSMSLFHGNATTTVFQTQSSVKKIFGMLFVISSEKIEYKTVVPFATLAVNYSDFFSKCLLK